MQWQDLALTAGSLVFIGALLPSIFSEHKPAIWTSFMTSFVLFVFTIVYASLDLIFAAITSAITAILWLLLASQKYKQLKHSDLKKGH